MFFRILILLLVSMAAGVRAQTIPTGSPDVSWQLDQSSVSPPTSAANETTVRQAGSNQQASVTIVGRQNQVSLNQTTSTNAARVQLTGRGNQLQLNQTGGANQLSVGLEGANNQLRVSQSSSDVMILSGLSGSNARLDLIQRNGNNTILTDGLTFPSTGQGVANLRIEQSGGATIRIQNGPSLRH